ncbi:MULTISPECIES: hypothetical protein [unclassified Microbacterium]|uniref:hypothetical protein n=1 Tax=unclassified Microbacterium TaxID=2609290 RepID=UPI00301A3427
MGASRREEVCRYDFTDENGALRFQKVRYRLFDPEPGGRNKDFRYFNPNALPIDRWRKPEGADRWIYNLPAVRRAIREGEIIHSVEGEKDADALIERGYVATSVHQGANKVTREQMAWLRDAAHVVIWVDKDVEHPEVGAHDAVMRHDHLIDLGSSGRIEFRRARGPWGGLKDVYDHLAAGYSLAEAVRINPERLADCAALYTPRKNWRVGYGRAA